MVFFSEVGNYGTFDRIWTHHRKATEAALVQTAARRICTDPTLLSVSRCPSVTFYDSWSTDQVDVAIARGSLPSWDKAVRNGGTLREGPSRHPAGPVDDLVVASKHLVVKAKKALL